MPMSKPTRAEMIDFLVQMDVESNLCDHKYMRERLRTGWVGYDQLSDQEIEDEYNSLQ